MYLCRCGFDFYFFSFMKGVLFGHITMKGKVVRINCSLYISKSKEQEMFFFLTAHLKQIIYYLTMFLKSRSTYLWRWYISLVSKTSKTCLTFSNYSFTYSYVGDISKRRLSMWDGFAFVEQIFLKCHEKKSRLCQSSLLLALWPSSTLSFGIKPFYDN